MGSRRICDRFELDAAAPSRGGMGEVHKAVDLRTGRRVALKLVDPRSPRVRARFQNEWELLARMEHPAIVEHVAHGQTEDGALYMAMEWLEGEDLASRLARGRLSLEDTVELGRRIAGALEVVHRHGVVHRDVKPGNIFLPGLRAQAAKLLDFGVAKDERRRMTGTGAFVGTPGYLAPEQARGAEVSPATDVFALGLVLYECLTGLAAFFASNPMSLLVKVAAQPAPKLAEERPDLPSALTRMVDKMLAHAPEDRFRDGAALVSAFDYLDEEEVTSRRRFTVTRLGESEQELLSVVIVRADDGEEPEPDEAEIPPIEVPGEVRSLLEEAGAPAEALVDGSLLVTVRSAAGADAQASIGARVALALARATPEHAVALATGRAPAAERGAIGEVIERAAALLVTEPGEAPEAQRAVAVDGLTAELLGPRFVVRESGERLELVGVEEEELDDGARLIGRGAELEDLRLRWEDEDASLVALTGDAGVGKSALLRRFAGWLREREPAAQVFFARGEPIGVGRTFGVLEALLRSATSVHRGDDPEVRLRRLRDRLEPILAEADRARVLGFCAELLGLTIEDDANADARRAAAEDPSLRGEQLRRAWEDWLRAEAARAPVLVVVDDVHFADEPSLSTLRAALTHVEPGGALAIVAGRDVEPSLTDDVIRLGPLEPEDAAEVAREALGALATEPDVERVVEGAGGNPYFLIELSRAVAAGESALPSSLVAISAARFAALPATARRVLRAASVFGMEAEVRGVTRLLGPGSDEMVANGLATLAGEGLLSCAHDRCSFRTALVREAAYASLTEEDRAAGHELAAQWLSERGDVDPLVLAEHWSRSRHPELAAGPIRLAAEMALEGHQFDRALELVELAEEVGADGGLLGEVLHIASQAHRWRGDGQAAVEAATRAMELLEERTDPWLGALAIAIRMAATSGMLDVVRDLSTRLVELEVRPQDRVSVLRTIGQVALPVLSIGDYDLAALLEARLDSLSAEVRSLEPYVAAPVRAARANFAHHRQDLVEYREHLLESADAFAEIGDHRMEIAQRLNAGAALSDIGEPELAERELSEAADRARELGLGHLVIGARVNLAVALMRQGRATEAVEIFEECLAQGLADPRLEGGVNAYLAEALRMLGERDRALEVAEQAQRQLEVAPPFRAAALAVMAQLHLDAGDAAEALRWSNEAYEVFKSLGQLESREELVLLVRAKAYHAAGKLDHARQAIEVAARRLEERASRISNRRKRERFLRGSPDRVETILLREEWRA